MAHFGPPARRLRDALRDGICVRRGPTHIRNGDFVATILLACAFIEHRLASHLRSKGYVKPARQGLAPMIACARQHAFASSFLLDKVDRLRRIRNPFVHLKPFDNDDGLLTRMMRGEAQEPTRLLEKDAKMALSLMYTMAVARLR